MVVLLLSPSACSWEALKEAEVTGAYRAQFYNGIEELTLKADGTFDETFTYRVDPSGHFGSPVGASYQNSGRWTFSNDRSDSVVVLDRAYVFQIGSEPPILTKWTLRARWADLPSKGIVLDGQDPDGVVRLNKID